MARCPHCGATVDSVEDLARDGEGYSDEVGAFGRVMYTCPDCEAILGVSDYRSDRGAPGDGGDGG